MELSICQGTRMDGKYSTFSVGVALKAIVGQCTTVAENYLVAHYDLKAPDTRVYGVSGNTLTIYEAFGDLAVGWSSSTFASDNNVLMHIFQNFWPRLPLCAILPRTIFEKGAYSRYHLHVIAISRIAFVSYRTHKIKMYSLVRRRRPYDTAISMTSTKPAVRRCVISEEGACVPPG